MAVLLYVIDFNVGYLNNPHHPILYFLFIISFLYPLCPKFLYGTLVAISLLKAKIRDVVLYAIQSCLYWRIKSRLYQVETNRGGIIYVQENMQCLELAGG